MEAPYFLQPKRTAGHLYHNVTTSCVYDRTGIPAPLAKPKSAILSSGFTWSFLTNKFCGLRSLWRTRRLWIYDKPYKSYPNKYLTCNGWSWPYWSMYFFKSRSTYSKTSVSFASVCITEIKSTILGCFNSLRIAISRIAVAGIPSSNESSFILFKATIYPVSVSFALYTVPYVPSPKHYVLS